MTVNAGMDARLIAFRAPETAQTNQFRDRADGYCPRFQIAVSVARLVGAIESRLRQRRRFAPVNRGVMLLGAPVRSVTCDREQVS